MSKTFIFLGTCSACRYLNHKNIIISIIIINKEKGGTFTENLFGFQNKLAQSNILAKTKKCAKYNFKLYERATPIA